MATSDVSFIPSPQVYDTHTSPLRRSLFNKSYTHIAFVQTSSSALVKSVMIAPQSKDDIASASATKASSSTNNQKQLPIQEIFQTSRIDFTTYMRTKLKEKHQTQLHSSSVNSNNSIIINDGNAHNASQPHFFKPLTQKQQYLNAKKERSLENYLRTTPAESAVTITTATTNIEKIPIAFRSSQTRSRNATQPSMSPQPLQADSNHSSNKEQQQPATYYFRLRNSNSKSHPNLYSTATAAFASIPSISEIKTLEQPQITLPHTSDRLTSIPSPSLQSKSESKGFLSSLRSKTKLIQSPHLPLTNQPQLSSPVTAPRTKKKKQLSLIQSSFANTHTGLKLFVSSSSKYFKSSNHSINSSIYQSSPFPTLTASSTNLPSETNISTAQKPVDKRLQTVPAAVSSTPQLTSNQFYDRWVKQAKLSSPVSNNNNNNNYNTSNNASASNLMSHISQRKAYDSSILPLTTSHQKKQMAWKNLPRQGSETQLYSLLKFASTTPSTTTSKPESQPTIPHETPLEKRFKLFKQVEESLKPRIQSRINAFKIVDRLAPPPVSNPLIPFSSQRAATSNVATNPYFSLDQADNSEKYPQQMPSQYQPRNISLFSSNNNAQVASPTNTVCATSTTIDPPKQEEITSHNYQSLDFQSYSLDQVVESEQQMTATAIAAPLESIKITFHTENSLDDSQIAKSPKSTTMLNFLDPIDILNRKLASIERQNKRIITRNNSLETVFELRGPSSPSHFNQKSQAIKQSLSQMSPNESNQSRTDEHGFAQISTEIETLVKNHLNEHQCSVGSPSNLQVQMSCFSSPQNKRKMTKNQVKKSAFISVTNSPQNLSTVKQQAGTTQKMKGVGHSDGFNAACDYVRLEHDNRILHELSFFVSDLVKALDRNCPDNLRSDIHYFCTQDWNQFTFSISQYLQFIMKRKEIDTHFICSFKMCPSVIDRVLSLLVAELIELSKQPTD